MRQAGRALPEYRRLKERYTFVELVQNPELAVEVTLQPIRRFGFDAAILFSDILVIPEAMGQAYHFRETGGVEMEFAVRSKADVDQLTVEQVCERLQYVQEALKRLRVELGDETALIGFSGSPWTLATFMMEGGSARESTRALDLFRSDRSTFHALMEKLTRAISGYLKMQAGCGVDALQIFDSHGGVLPAAEFHEASGRWMREIVSELGARRPGGGKRAAFRSLSSLWGPTTTGPTWWTRGQPCWAWTGRVRWRRCERVCLKASRCRETCRRHC
jgi:uroporphyrinogen decarboxylase